MPTLNTISGKRLDLVVMSGDTLQFEVIFHEDDNITGIDLSGIDFKMQIKKRYLDAIPSMEASLGNGLTIGDEIDPNTLVVLNTNNVLSFFGDVGIKGLTDGYVYDIQAKDPGPPVVTTTYLFGRFLPQQDVTESNLES